MTDDDGSEPADGLRGPDKQQGRLRDVQGGTYETAAPTSAPDAHSPERTEHQRRPPGADVRQGVPDSEMTKQEQPDLPEGLVRERQGPYDCNLGRQGETSPSPAPSPGRSKA